MDSYTEYEIKAAAFRRVTGMMAPGKDEPAVCGGHHMGERIAAWDKWTAENHRIIKAMLLAMTDVMQREEGK